MSVPQAEESTTARIARWSTQDNLQSQLPPTPAILPALQPHEVTLADEEVRTSQTKKVTILEVEKSKRGKRSRPVPAPTPEPDESPASPTASKVARSHPSQDTVTPAPPSAIRFGSGSSADVEARVPSKQRTLAGAARAVTFAGKKVGFSRKNKKEKKEKGDEKGLHQVDVGLHQVDCTHMRAVYAHARRILAKDLDFVPRKSVAELSASCNSRRQSISLGTTNLARVARAIMQAERQMKIETLIAQLFCEAGAETRQKREERAREAAEAEHALEMAIQEQAREAAQAEHALEMAVYEGRHRRHGDVTAQRSMLLKDFVMPDEQEEYQQADFEAQHPCRPSAVRLANIRVEALPVLSQLHSLPKRWRGCGPSYISRVKQVLAEAQKLDERFEAALTDLSQKWATMAKDKQAPICKNFHVMEKRLLASNDDPEICDGCLQMMDDDGEDGSEVFWTCLSCDSGSRHFHCCQQCGLDRTSERAISELWDMEPSMGWDDAVARAESFLVMPAEEPESNLAGDGRLGGRKSIVGNVDFSTLTDFSSASRKLANRSSTLDLGPVGPAAGLTSPKRQTVTARVRGSVMLQDGRGTNTFQDSDLNVVLAGQKVSNGSQSQQSNESTHNPRNNERMSRAWHRSPSEQSLQNRERNSIGSEPAFQETTEASTCYKRASRKGETHRDSIIDLGSPHMASRFSAVSLRSTFSVAECEDEDEEDDDVEESDEEGLNADDLAMIQERMNQLAERAETPTKSAGAQHARYKPIAPIKQRRRIVAPRRHVGLSLEDTCASRQEPEAKGTPKRLKERVVLQRRVLAVVEGEEIARRLMPALSSEAGNDKVFRASNGIAERAGETEVESSVFEHSYTAASTTRRPMAQSVGEALVAPSNEDTSESVTLPMRPCSQSPGPDLTLAAVREALTVAQFLLVPNLGTSPLPSPQASNWLREAAMERKIWRATASSWRSALVTHAEAPAVIGNEAPGETEEHQVALQDEALNVDSSLSASSQSSSLHSIGMDPEVNLEDLMHLVASRRLSLGQGVGTLFASWIPDHQWALIQQHLQEHLQDPGSEPLTIEDWTEIRHYLSINVGDQLASTGEHDDAGLSEEQWAVVEKCFFEGHENGTLQSRAGSFAYPGGDAEQETYAGESATVPVEEHGVLQDMQNSDEEEQQEVPDVPVESFVDWPLHKGSMPLAENDEKRSDWCENVPEATGFCHLQQDPEKSHMATSDSAEAIVLPDYTCDDLVHFPPNDDNCEDMVIFGGGTRAVTELADAAAEATPRSASRQTNSRARSWASPSPLDRMPTPCGRRPRHGDYWSRHRRSHIGGRFRGVGEKLGSGHDKAYDLAPAVSGEADRLPSFSKNKAAGRSMPKTPTNVGPRQGDSSRRRAANMCLAPLTARRWVDGFKRFYEMPDLPVVDNGEGGGCDEADWNF